MSLFSKPPLRFATRWAIVPVFILSVATAATRAGLDAGPDTDTDTDTTAAATSASDPCLHQHARQAVGADAERAGAAIRALRQAGPDGLQVLLQTHRLDIERLWIPQPLPAAPDPDPDPAANRSAIEPPSATRHLSIWFSPDNLATTVRQAHARAASGERRLARLRHAIEQVAAQRDAHASGLFWHTDLAAAKRAAAELQRPILSLRLLGRLDEELSCANSRLFRTTLYPDPGISELLRESFVLHWESVRPAPRITIDYGDGRRFEQTITGNSIHYLLALDGTPLDALPGLYSPREFAGWLTEAIALTEQYVRRNPAHDMDFLRRHHRERLQIVRGTMPELLWEDWLSRNGRAGQMQPEARAAAAAALTMAKTIMEFPALRQAGMGGPSPAPPLADMLVRDSERRRGEVELSPEARALIRAKQGAGHDPARLAAMVGQLEQAIAGDTALNEMVLRPRLRQWFAEGLIPSDLGQLTDLVYADLFLTPLDDPWMGLAETEFWPALDHGGRRQDQLANID